LLVWCDCWFGVIVWCDCWFGVIGLVVLLNQFIKNRFGEENMGEML
jgi:hypothetical protein